MQQFHKYNKPTANIPQANLILFNQHSTDQLLKQLRVSLKNVQQIIEKSKQSLGLKPGIPDIRSPLPREGSSFNFNVSLDTDQSSIKDQLTYSMSPQTDSRFKNISTIKTIGNRTSQSLYKRILFEDGKQIVQKQNNQIIHPIPTQNRSNQIKTKQVSIEFPSFQKKITHEKQSHNVNGHRRLTDLCLQICTSDEPDEQQQFRYEEQYCIIINKGNKKQKPNSSESDQDEQTVKKYNQFNQLERQKTKNSQAQQQNQIIYKRLDFDSDQNQCEMLQLDKTTIQTQQKMVITQYQQSNFDKFGKDQQFGRDKSVLINTCSKNEMQNILILNSNTKRNKNINVEQEITKSPKIIQNPRQVIRLSGKKSFQKKKINKSNSPLVSKWDKPKPKSPIKNTKRSPSKSPSKSPIRSGSNTKRTEKMSPSKCKPNYIQKYINVLSYKSQKKQKQEIGVKKQLKKPQYTNKYLEKYSHPLKPLQKRRSAILQIHEHTNEITKDCNKELFMSLMKKQCYVNRFLNENQLEHIFLQFVHKKIPRYLWEQRVIEKIFKKIHQSDQII